MAKHWTVAEAKARLSEIMRLASHEGPQRIGAQGDYLLISAAQWERLNQPAPPLGQWLLKHLQAEVELELPDRLDPPREDLFQ